MAFVNLYIFFIKQICKWRDYLFQNLCNNSPEILSQLADVNVYKVTLNPGDVLYVPRHWWHSVHNTTSQDGPVQNTTNNQDEPVQNNTNPDISLPVTVSVNTWVPCPQQDLEAKLHECLVRIHAAQHATVCTR